MQLKLHQKFRRQLGICLHLERPRPAISATQRQDRGDQRNPIHEMHRVRVLVHVLVPMLPMRVSLLLKLRLLDKGYIPSDYVAHEAHKWDVGVCPALHTVL